jgi:cytochrome c biogenesis protein CcmG, thiol:disulfide interchange protein DsbE
VTVVGCLDFEAVRMTNPSATKIVQKAANPSGEKSTRVRRALSWAAYLIVFVGILYFFAPPSWWQFGVLPSSERTMLPGLHLKDIDGRDWKLADQSGKVVVVNYWATWCPPCRIETPGLVNLYNEYRSRGVGVVGVTMDEDLDSVPPFVESYQIKYPILLPGRDPNISPDGIALPTTFLYDKNGRLAKKYTGMVLESTFRSDVEALLTEQ